MEKINIFTKNSRKFQLAVNRLELLFNLKDLNDNFIITYGYIIKIKDKSIKVYLPEYKLEEKIRIISNKFEKITNVEKKYNLENELLSSIKYNLEGESKEYKLYEKIDVKMWIFIKSENIFDKLVLEII